MENCARRHTRIPLVLHRRHNLQFLSVSAGDISEPPSEDPSLTPFPTASRGCLLEWAWAGSVNVSCAPESGMTNVHLHVTRARRARCADGSGHMHVPVFIYQYECGGRDPRGRSRLTHGAGAGSARPVTYDARSRRTRPRPLLGNLSV